MLNQFTLSLPYYVYFHSDPSVTLLSEYFGCSRADLNSDRWQSGVLGMALFQMLCSNTI